MGERPSEELLKRIVDAVVRAVDPAKLERELEATLGAASTGDAPKAPKAGDDLLGRLVLCDVLDDSILGAAAGDKAYPLRVLMTHLGESLATDTGLAFACALNVYFRVAMDDEVKMRLGIEASRLYYRFALERTLESELVAQASLLLATLLSGELARLRFESVDAARVFDSMVHERAEDADPASAQIRAPVTFLCRVTATQLVRVRALVRT
jgi:hypothetical protein